MMFAQAKGRSLTMGNRLAGACLLLGLTLGAATGCQKGGGPGVTTAAAKTVGAIDQEVLYALPEFKKAEEQVKAQADKKRAELDKMIPKTGKLTDEQRKLITQKQMEMQKEANSLIDPLKDRVQAAILKVSRDKKLMVVLDKRIVVYGVPDITDEVKAAFQASGDIKTGDEVDTSKAPVGYFDQDVVRSLKVFQQAEMDIYKKRGELARDFEKKAPNLSPPEREMLQRELTIKLDTYREGVMTPLIQQVNDAVKEVAEGQSLSLVLDKQHVMTGGRNMTSEVVETFLKKAGAVPGGKTPKPAGSATPAGGQ